MILKVEAAEKGGEPNTVTVYSDQYGVCVGRISPKNDCAYCDEPGCSSSWHRAERRQLDVYTSIYRHPGLAMKALWCQSEYLDGRRKRLKLMRRQDTNHLDDEESNPDEKIKSLDVFKLCDDDNSAVTGECVLPGSSAICTARGYIIGFDSTSDDALIVFVSNVEGNMKYLPSLCPYKYLPSQFAETRTSFLEDAKALSEFSDKIDTDHMKFEMIDADTSILITDGVFKNKRIDDHLLASIGEGLVSLKIRQQYKYRFRFTAKKDFWFREKKAAIDMATLNLQESQ